MSLLHALILGIIQGLTEFFPISSSAHLKLAKFMLGLNVEEPSVLFDLSCHLGTLTALIFYLRKEIISLLIKNRSALKGYFIALLPLIPAYFLLKPLREALSELHYVGIFLCLTGLLLWVGSRIQLSLIQRPLRDAFVIGTLQSIALIPGISRSASTISGARFLGWDAKTAVQFSFLLSIPTILGGNCLELFKTIYMHPEMSIPYLNCFIGFISSFGMGIVMIRFALKWLESGKLNFFAYYCLVLGILSTFYLYRI